MDEANSYVRDSSPDNFAALKVRFKYHFDVGGPQDDFFAITDYVIYGDGTYTERSAGRSEVTAMNATRHDERRSLIQALAAAAGRRPGRPARGGGGRRARSRRGGSSPPAARRRSRTSAVASSRPAAASGVPSLEAAETAGPTTSRRSTRRRPTGSCGRSPRRARAMRSTRPSRPPTLRRSASASGSCSGRKSRGTSARRSG